MLQSDESGSREAIRSIDAAALATGMAAAADGVLWDDLSTARDQTAFAAAWLSITARTFPPIRQAVFLFQKPNGGALDAITRWAATQADANTEALVEGGKAVLHSSVEERRPAIELAHGLDRATFASLPFVIDDKVFGAVLVQASIDDEMSGRRLIRHLKWASAWVEAHVRRRQSGETKDRAGRAEVFVEIFNALTSEPKFTDASRVLADAATKKIGCERAAVGWRRGLSTQLTGASQSAGVDRKTALARAFEQAMDEAIDQEAVLTAPADASSPNRLIAYAQEALRAKLGAASVLTIPMTTEQGDIVGAITLIRESRAFTPADGDFAEAIASAAAPVLRQKHESDRSIFGLIAVRMRRFGEMLLGPRNAMAKAAGLALAALLTTAWFAHDIHRVTARGHVHGDVRRVVSTPFDGYIRAQYARAGQTVRQGEVLAELQDNDLVLDRLRHVTERQQHKLEYDRAASKRELAQMNIAKAQIEQKDAEIELTDQMLARAKVTAAFDAVIVSGDLSQSVGKPVSRGDVLYELAPLDRYRVTLVVPEADIGAIKAGQAGEILLVALPEHPFKVEVTSVTPVARVVDGVNGFEVSADLKETDPRIRPAMVGTAKIEAGEARIMWIWAHGLLQWLRILTWPWLP